MRKILVIHRRVTGGVEDCHGEAAWWGHYTPNKCKRRFVLLFCLFISIIFFIGDLEFDGEEWGFLLVFGEWAEEWRGLLGLHRSILYRSVFFWKIRGLLFSVYWTFFPGGLASYNFFFFFFQILVQNFFGLFFYLIVFLILTRVFLFFLKGKQIKKINYYI